VTLGEICGLHPGPLPGPRDNPGPRQEFVGNSDDQRNEREGRKRIGASSVYTSATRMLLLIHAVTPRSLPSIHRYSCEETMRALAKRPKHRIVSLCPLCVLAVFAANSRSHKGGLVWSQFRGPCTAARQHVIQRPLNQPAIRPMMPSSSDALFLAANGSKLIPVPTATDAAPTYWVYFPYAKAVQTTPRLRRNPNVLGRTWRVR
jgi:hypothetical protein